MVNPYAIFLPIRVCLSKLLILDTLQFFRMLIPFPVFCRWEAISTCRGCRGRSCLALLPATLQSAKLEPQINDYAPAIQTRKAEAPKR